MPTGLFSYAARGAKGACCLASVVVAILATILGLLFSGALAKTGVFAMLDGLEMGRGKQLMGLAPAFHRGTPWGFTVGDMPNLKGHVVLVTGANVGLGYWTCYHAARAHATVVMACRSAAKCDLAKAEMQGDVRVLKEPLDLASFRSVRAFSKSFREQFDRLDALVLNAGIMMTPFHLTEDGIESQIGTNHFGHFLLTQELMPKLEAAAAARGTATVTSVSSSAHFTSYPEGVRLTLASLNNGSSYTRREAYGQSKLANVLFAQELAERSLHKGILSNAVHPGAVDTELGRHILPVLRATLGDRVTNAILESLQSAVWHPKDAALTQLYAAVSDEVREKKITGKYFHPIARQTQADPHARNATLQRELWRLTEDFVASH